MTKLENRSSKRVQFFLVPVGGHEIRPVWVFNSEEQGKALPGLVVNLSEGGMQVLTDLDEQLPVAEYRLAFLPDETSAGLALADCTIQLVWSEREAGLHTRSGFTFVGETPADLLALLQRPNVEELFLRCAIAQINHEVEQEQAVA
jgi:hypothetical protein